MKKMISLAIVISTLVLALCSCGASDKRGVHHVEMTFENYGTVKIALYGDIAPITVKNFLDLAKSGYYNGTSIIRVQSGFVIQGGSGAGTSTIKGEFTQNGVNNTIKHKRGTISMARSTALNSASDQFFICLDDSSASVLDGAYAGFGEVIEGMEVIDAIVESLKSSDFNDDAYYGGYMGFLKPTSYIKIESVKVID